MSARSVIIKYPKFGILSSPVLQGGSMVIGLAFWPDGALSDWGDIQTGAHPCDPANRTALVRLPKNHNTSNL